MNDFLAHYGILGMKWGIRRYQNPDGTLTDAGRRRIAKKDSKWANRNYDKIYKKTYKASKKEMNSYVKNELNPKYKNQKHGAYYRNEYNRKLAEIMNKNVSDITSPSGRVVRWVAKRGDVGVHMALASADYDMSSLKNGVYGSGRIAYKKDRVDVE